MNRFAVLAVVAVLAACTKPAGPPQPNWPPPADVAEALPAQASPTVDAAAAVSPAAATSLSIANDATSATTVFVSFGADSAIKSADWSAFCTASAPLNCAFPLAAQTTLTIALNANLNAMLSFDGQGCGTSKAELNLHNPAWFDVADVSLVDGFNRNIAIELDGLQLGPTQGAGDNAKAFGVFPLGCDVCVARQSPPCGIAPSPTPGSAGCKHGTQFSPDVPCQAQGKHKGGGGTVVVKALP